VVPPSIMCCKQVSGRFRGGWWGPEAALLLLLL
jgi:hypothetical protein